MCVCVCVSDGLFRFSTGKGALYKRFLWILFTRIDEAAAAFDGALAISTPFLRTTIYTYVVYTTPSYTLSRALRRLCVELHFAKAILKDLGGRREKRS